MQPGRIRTDRAAAAAVDYRYLLSHDYSARSALEFVGNHFQLRSEERDFLFRAVCSFEKAVSRRKKVVPVEELAGSRLIDQGPRYWWRKARVICARCEAMPHRA